MTENDAAAVLSPNKMITLILPDDGTDKALIKALHSEKGVTTANSSACRGISALRPAKGKMGKLPEPEAVKLVNVMVDGESADELFAYIYDKANIEREGGGLAYMSNVSMATLFTLPEDVELEV
uniref:Nitrogen regulatory protein P-II n=1 Tax=Magnetococcus massalia (strain MO-1) TaxID=451514 RepID=A0A1S7LNK2_MAGMO|nr:conserved protein of unknown function [Candidatus Magnetococcus massalia]